MPKNITDALIQDTQSLVKGMARGATTDLVGAPVDIVAATMRGLGVPIPPEPVLGSKHLRRLTGQPAEDNPVETVGSMINPAGAVLKGAAVAGTFLRASRGEVQLLDKMQSEGRIGQDIYSKTGLFRSADGMGVRKELSDAESTFTKHTDSFFKGKEKAIYGKLDSLVDHKSLLDHPDVGDALKEYNVILKRSDDKHMSGYMDPNNKIIEVSLGKDTSKQEAMSIILHEMQHVVQQKMGMHRGANTMQMQDAINNRQLKGKAAHIAENMLEIGNTPESVAHLLYWSMAGEVEARAVAARYGMTFEQLKATMPSYDTSVYNVLTKVK